MQVYAGEGCRVYRQPAPDEKPVLTQLRRGDPVPELRNRKAHHLKRLEQRGIVRVDWDADDAVVNASRRAHTREESRAAPSSITKSPHETTVGDAAPAQASAHESVTVPTSRGATTHLVHPEGNRLLCGQTYDPTKEVADEVKRTAKLCGRCAKRASDSEE